MKFDWIKIEARLLKVLLGAGGIIIALAVFLVLLIAYFRIN